MNSRMFVRIGLLAMMFVLPFAGRTAMAAPAVEKATDVGVQQQRIQRDFQELEQKVMRVITALQETDPERAQRLQGALDFAREKIVSGRMGSVAELLNASKHADARKLQPGMTVDLEAMLNLLQEDLGEYDRLQKRIEQLEAWLKKTQELAREEWTEMRDSEKLQDAEAAKKRLDEQIARAEGLLAEQKALKNQTEKAQVAGKPGFDNEEEKQKELEDKTRALAKDLKSDGKSGKADEAGKAGEAGEGSEAGEQALDEAATAQAEAAKELAAKKTPPALEKQAKAVAKLEQAVREMKKERDRQKQMDAQKAKDAQDQTEKKAGELSQEMAKADSSAGESGQPGEPGQPGQPGQPSIQEAQEAMKQASKQLEKKSPDKAAPAQKEAHKKLQKASEDLKKEIQKVKDEQRDALRALLKDLLEKMLVQQKTATLRTVTLNEAKEKKKWTDERRLELGGVRESEERIGQMANRVSEVLENDGSSIVFGAVLADLQQALSNVVSVIGQEDIGVSTQDAQREIEKMIEDLLAALAESKEPPPPPPPSEDSPPPPPPPPPPLIAIVEELRLLRTQQIRVNQRTTAIQKNVKPMPADLQRVSDQQRKIHDITTELLMKLTK